MNRRSRVCSRSVTQSERASPPSDASQQPADPRPGWNWTLILAPGCVLGAIAACFMMYVAWQHNAQSEFWDEESVHWLSLGTLGLGWFLVISIPVVVVAFLAMLASGLARTTGRSN